MEHSSNSEQAKCLRLIEGLEAGTLDLNIAFQLSEEIDPVLLHVALRYLREVAGADGQTGEGVNSRLLEFATSFPQAIKMAQKGEKDPILEWFNESYALNEFRSRPNDLVEILWEKIDG